MVPARILAASALAMVPATSLAARWTATVVLVPQDKGAHAASTRIREYLQAAIGSSSQYRIGAATEQVFGTAVSSQADEALAAAKAELGEGKRFFSQGYLEEAEAKFRATLKALERAVPVLDKCGEYCDAVAYLGAVLQMKSDDNAAREFARAVLILDPKYRFEGRGFGQNYALIARDIQRTMSRDAQFSTASLYSTPPGGRVFIDGNFKGYTPLSVEQIAAGKHLIRIERGGAFVWGQVVTISPTEDAVVKAKLSPTPEFEAVDPLIDSAVAELDRSSAGANVLALCKQLKVDRAVVGLVRSSADTVVIEAALFDARTQKRIARRRATFEGDEYGQLEREVQKFANGLIADAERRVERVTSKDPLESVSGMEEWGDEPASGSEEKRRGRRSSDSEE